MSKKRRMIAIAGLVLAATSVTTAAALTVTGCTQEEENVATSGMYYNADSDLSVILYEDGYKYELTDGNNATITGEYFFNGTTLTLTVTEADGGSYDITGTFDSETGKLTITYKETSYELSVTKKVTLSFETDGGTSVDAQTVWSGNNVSRPADPTKSGYYFVDWYTDSTYATKYNFDAAVSADTKAYARFVEIDEAKNVYTVTFDAGEGATMPTDYEYADNTAYTTETVNGMVYKLPTPTKSGATFVGWWVSHYDSKDKLTYKYSAEELTQDTTFYAVWSTDGLVASVKSSGVTLYNAGSSSTVTITDSDGKTVKSESVLVDTVAYEFSSAMADEYTITVTSGDATAYAYYKNKGLAKVTEFTVDGDVISFEGVDEATDYQLAIVCGEHEDEVIDLGGKTSYDFSECGMTDEGTISFTVTASAEGHVSSVGKYVLDRKLANIENLTFSDDKAEITWSAVKNAESYTVKLTVGNDTKEVVVKDTSYDIRSYTGAISVEVTAKAFGYNASEKATYSETLTRLVSPEEVKVAETITWSAVEGATGYTVKVGSQELTTENTYLDISEVLDSAQTSSVSVSVKANAADSKNDSAYTAAQTVGRSAINHVYYSNGEITWDSVYGAVQYGVKINGGTEQLVEADDGTLLEIELTENGDNTIAVRYYTSSGWGSEWKTITVAAYKVTYYNNDGTEKNVVKYYAEGDDIKLPEDNEVTREGYTLTGWYTGKSGGKKLKDGVEMKTSEVTYYARWEGNEYTITLDLTSSMSTASITFTGSESTVTKKAVTVVYGSAMGNLEIPVISDAAYAFAGWYTQPNGAGVQVTDGNGASEDAWGTAADTTLYPSFIKVFDFEELKDGTYAIVKNGTLPSSIKELTIPATYNNKTVSTIAGDAFASCTGLVKVRIPSTITTVDCGSNGGNMTGSAFRGCTNIEEIEVYTPEGAETNTTGKYYESIDGVLYYRNTQDSSFTLVYFPYKKVPNGEFTFPSDLTNIPDCALYAIKGLTKVVIPASVTYVGTNAFKSCTALTEVTFENAAEGETAVPLTLGVNVFKGCSKLVKATLPARLNRLSYTYTEKTDTKFDVVYDNNETIYDSFYGIFDNCTKLEYVSIAGTGGYYASGSEISSELDGLIVTKNADTDSTYNTVVYCPKAKTGSITIPEGIEYIADRAFYYCSKLTSVSVPSTVKEIGELSFYYCLGITSVTFNGTHEDSNLTIRAMAFHYCTGLTSITLPENLAVLETYAFSYCTKLKTVTVLCNPIDRSGIDYQTSAFDNGLDPDKYPSYVTKLIIGENVQGLTNIKGVFSGKGTKLATVEVDSDNTSYSSVNGVLYNKDITTVLFYPSGRGTEYTLPSTVTKIGSAAFSGIAFTSFEIPATVTEIADLAFSDCAYLTSLTFAAREGAALTIGEEAFGGCVLLTEITLPEGVTVVEKAAFNGCTALETVNMPSTLTQLSGTAKTNTAAEVFSGCTALKAINVTQGATYGSIDGVLCGVKDGKLTSILYAPAMLQGDAETNAVTIAATITSVGTEAFKDNTTIKHLVFADHTDDTTITIEEGAFHGCTALESLTLPVGLETVSVRMAYMCTALTTVNIPYTVKSINAGAFAGCTALTTVTFNATPEGKEAVALSFATGSITTKPTAKQTTTNIKKMGAFCYCSAITELSLPDRAADLGAYTFYKCEAVTSVTIPADTKTIGKYVFGNCTGLQQISIHKNVTTVADYAFANCSNLDTVTFEEGGTTAVTIGNYAFSTCKKLGAAIYDEEDETKLVRQGKLTLPTKVASIGNNCFYNCTGLTEFDCTGTGVTSLGNSVFSGCSALTKVVLADTIISIGYSAFQNCKALTDVTLPDNTKLDNYATMTSTFDTLQYAMFSTCTSLESVTIPSTIKKIGDKDTSAYGVFYKCSALKSITIPKSVESISKYTFNLCESLTTVTFETDSTTNKASITTMGDYAFAGTAIEEFTFPVSSGEAIKNSAGKNDLTALFSGVTTLKKVNLSSSVLSVSYMFDECKSSPAITISSDNKALMMSDDGQLVYGISVTDDATTINSVNYCAGLANDTPATFTVSAKVTAIGDGAFRNQNYITKIIIPSTVTTIGVEAFAGCSLLEKVTFEVDADGKCALTSIEEEAFKNCFSLKTIAVGTKDGVLPSTLTSIGASAFAETALEELTIPSSVTTMGNYAFEYCASLKKVTILNSKFSDGEFAYCYSLATVVLPSTLKTFGTASSIFESCVSLVTVQYCDEDGSNVTGTEGTATFPENLANFSTTKKAAIFKNTGLKKIIMPAKITAYTENAYTFIDCEDLEEITFPSSVSAASVSLAAYMFMGCSSLKTINNSDAIASAGDYCFAGCGFETLALDKCATIGASCFKGCYSLKEISLKSCTSIGNTAFAGGSATVSISCAAATLATVASRTYASCYNLEKVTLPDSTSTLKVTIGTNAFGCTSVKYQVTVTEKVYKEYTCYALKTINLDRVQSVGGGAFAALSLEEVSLPICETIGDYAFGLNPNLKKVTLSESVNVTIGKYAFAGYDNGRHGCINLQEINLKNVVSVAANAFYKCSALKGTKQSDGTYILDLANIESIAGSAFSYSAIESVKFGKDLTSLLGSAFSHCESLKSILGGEHITVAGGTYIFQTCTALETIDSLAKLETIGEYMFSGCTSLKGALQEDGTYALDISGATSVGKYAFYGCDALQNVVMYQSVDNTVEIGSYAFYGDEALTSIDFSRVAGVGDYAFKGCVGIEGALDLSALTSIGEYAFTDCTGITKINITSAKEVGEGAFEDCTGIAEVEFCEGLTTIGDYAFKNCSALTAITLSQETTTIGKGAFFESGLAGELDLTYIQTIGADAFAGTELTKITLGDALLSVGADAFGQISTLTGFAMTSAGTYQVKDGMLYTAADDDGVVSLVCCPAGTSATEVSVTKTSTIESYALAGCSVTVKVAADAELPKAALWCFSGTVEYTASESVTADAAKYNALVNGAYYGSGYSGVLDLSSATLTEIPEGAFRNMSKITKIILPEGLTTIGDYAFAGCSALAEIVIPSTVTSIGNYAFEDCSALTTITLPAGLKTVGDYAFSSAGLTSITVPDGVESLGVYVFFDCEALETATFGKNVGSLGRNAFSYCTALKSVTFGDGMGSIGAGAFSSPRKEPASATAVPGLESGYTQVYLENLETVTFAGTCKSIAAYAFYRTGIKSFTFPKGLESVGNYAIGGVSASPMALEEVTFLSDVGTYDEEGKFTNGMGNYLFYSCPYLKKITYAEGVTVVGGKFMFLNAGSGLADDEYVEISLPSTLTTIGQYAFRTVKVNNITLPESVTEIGNQAFYGCDYLTEINIPTGVTAIGQMAFYECEKLAIEVTLGSNLTSIGAGAFYGTSITKLTIADGADEETGYKITSSYGGTTWYGAFQNCVSLTSVSLGKGLTSLEPATFGGCTSLTDVTLPSTLTAINGGYSTTTGAFQDTAITSITLPDGLEKIGYNAFRGSKLTTFTFPSGAEEIELMSYAFADCASLTSITIPKTVTANSNYGYFFSGCTALTSITLEEGITKISDYWFAGLDSDVTIKIPTTVTSIGSMVFLNCGENVKCEITVSEGLNTLEFSSTWNKYGAPAVKVTYVAPASDSGDGDNSEE